MGDNVYGVEFSVSGNFLYATSYDVSCKLAQFNISLATLPLILASKTPLSATDDLYGLQMGPDGKIYLSRSFTSQFLGVINNPDIAGSGCNYVENGLDLDPFFMGVNGALSLPSFMQTYLKLAAGATCLSTEIAENSSEIFVPIYPNPTCNEFTINASSLLDISVYDYTGKLIEQHNNISSVIHFGKEYSKGIYFVKLKVGNNWKSYKIVKS
jgi:hypothetical protein